MAERIKGKGLKLVFGDVEYPLSDVVPTFDEIPFDSETAIVGGSFSFNFTLDMSPEDMMALDDAVGRAHRAS